jgi:hypothetical protein
MPGPIPKRSDVRRRVNKPEIPIVSAPTGGEPVEAPPADPQWHDIARRWYEALGRSGQSCFFEPSDWAHAALVAEAMSRMLTAERMSAQMFAAVDSSSVRLMVTEGDRRRLRVELERRRVVDEDEEAAVASLDEWRSRLGG